MRKNQIKLAQEYAVRLGYGRRGPVTRCKAVELDAEESGQSNSYGNRKWTRKGTRVETLDSRPDGWSGKKQPAGEKVIVENRRILAPWAEHDLDEKIRKAQSVHFRAQKEIHADWEAAEDNAFRAYLREIAFSPAANRGGHLNPDDADDYSFPRASRPRQFEELLVAAFGDHLSDPAEAKQALVHFGKALDAAENIARAAFAGNDAKRDDGLKALGVEKDED